ncbi:hypothetical protein EJB05_51790, partial [Eragrostis curvula]
MDKLLEGTCNNISKGRAGGKIRCDSPTQTKLRVTAIQVKIRIRSKDGNKEGPYSCGSGVDDDFHGFCVRFLPPPFYGFAAGGGSRRRGDVECARTGNPSRMATSSSPPAAGRSEDALIIRLSDDKKATLSIFTYSNEVSSIDSWNKKKKFLRTNEFCNN